MVLTSHLSKIGSFNTNVPLAKTKSDGTRSLSQFPLSVMKGGRGKILDGLSMAIASSFQVHNFQEQSLIVDVDFISTNAHGLIAGAGYSATAPTGGLTFALQSGNFVVAVELDSKDYTIHLEDNYQSIKGEYAATLDKSTGEIRVLKNGKFFKSQIFPELINCTFAHNYKFTIGAGTTTDLPSRHFFDGGVRKVIFLSRILTDREIRFDFTNPEESYSNLSKDNSCVWASHMSNNGNYVPNDAEYEISDNLLPNYKFYDTSFHFGSFADLTVEEGQLVVTGTGTVPVNQKGEITASDFIATSIESEFAIFECEITESNSSTGWILYGATFLDTGLNYFYPSQVGKYKMIIKGNLTSLVYHAGTGVGAIGKFKNPSYRKVKGIYPIIGALQDNADTFELEGGMQTPLFKMDKVGAFVRPNTLEDGLNFDEKAFINSGVFLTDDLTATIKVIAYVELDGKSKSLFGTEARELSIWNTDTAYFKYKNNWGYGYDGLNDKKVNHFVAVIENGILQNFYINKIPQTMWGEGSNDGMPKEAYIGAKHAENSSFPSTRHTLPIIEVDVKKGKVYTQEDVIREYNEDFNKGLLK